MEEDHFKKATFMACDLGSPILNGMMNAFYGPFDDFWKFLFYNLNPTSSKNFGHVPKFIAEKDSIN